MSEPLLHLALRVEQDIFLVRQRGREVAAAVGLEHQDQVRIATALSEVARELLSGAGNYTTPVVYQDYARKDRVIVAHAAAPKFA